MGWRGGGSVYERVKGVARRETNRQTDRQTETERDTTETDRQTDRQTESKGWRERFLSL